MTPLWTTSAAILQAMQDPSVPAEHVLREAGDAAPSWLPDALAAARAPEFRIWTEGEAPPLTVHGRVDRSLLVIEPDGALGVTVEEIPVALWGLLDLGVRPIAAVDPVSLPPGAMSEFMGRRQAHGHGLPTDQAEAWQQVLDGNMRHWSVRFSRPTASEREWRRNVEALDGDTCLARVRQLADGRVELAPTSSTALLRALIGVLTDTISHR